MVSPTQSLAQIGDVIFRVPPRHDTPVVFSLGGHRLHDRRRDADPRAADSWRGGGGVTGVRFAARRSDASQQVVRAGHRPERRERPRAARASPACSGPNGAGKSTFMKLITGQLKPSKGQITVFGEPIWGNPALFFRVGFCPEQDAFYERMTGLEWVQALVRLNGYGEAEALLGGDRRARAGGSHAGRQQEDRRLQQGHAPAREAGAGARARSRAAHPRRAAERHGSDHAAPHDSAGQGLGARRQEHPRLEPHPARDRGDDVEHPADSQRPDSRRRATSIRSAI